LHEGVPSWRPTHVYVPGKSERHPEGLFDWIKRDAAFPDGVAFQYGLGFLNDGYFWEAHEVLEAVWMSCPQNSTEKLLIQALIQWANAGLKFRMARNKAAWRLLDLADELYQELELRKVIGHSVNLRNEIDQIKVVVKSYEI
jgi:predicted metal-dependent hydrolase